MKIFLFALVTLFTTNLLSSDNVGIIVRKKGSVEHLTSPSKKFIKKKNVVLYKGLYYQKKKARPGSKIKNGDIISTGKKSKARIVYKNGDQFNISPGSALKISWKKEKFQKKDSSTIELLNGAVRGIISKKGPRNNLKVKSRTAVMGVRGTDFHFSQKGTSGATNISVLRGKVEVTKKLKPKRPVKVNQGFSVTLNKVTKLRPKTQILVNKTTKNDLFEIQKESKILKPDTPKITKLEKDNIKDLEKKAIKNTLEDIKEYQPEVYKVLKEKKITEVDTVNTVVVTKAIEKAPLKKSKKGLDDLDLDLDESAYDKYFKIEDAL